VKINGPSLAVVLRGVVGEDFSYGLSIWNGGTIVRTGGSGRSRRSCVGKSSAVGIAAGLASGHERSSVADGSGAENGGEDVNV